MKLKKLLGMLTAAAMLACVMTAAAVMVNAEETENDPSTWDEATYDTAASSTWDEASWDEAASSTWDMMLTKSYDGAAVSRISPKTGTGSPLAIILACGGFAAAGLAAKKLL